MRAPVLVAAVMVAAKKARSSIGVTVMGVVSLSALCNACSGDICNRNSDEAPADFRDGLTSTSGTLYMTAEPDERYLDFPSGQKYRLFHDLANTPSLIVPYVSFSPAPLVDGSGFTISPGNQTVVHAVTNQYIEVENDTCTDFFLRVVASTDNFGPAAAVISPPNDAGADSGN